MEPLTIKEANGKKTKLMIPSKWEELTLKQLIKIESLEENDVLKMFSIITDIIGLSMRIKRFGLMHRRILMDTPVGVPFSP